VAGAANQSAVWATRTAETIAHVLARHVEVASHMAEVTRCTRRQPSVCASASQSAARHDHRPYQHKPTASDPVHNGHAARALHKEDFQAVDIASIAKPSPSGHTSARAGAVPRAFQQAFHLMRSGRPGPVLIDLRSTWQMPRSNSTSIPIEPMSSTSPRIA